MNGSSSGDRGRISYDDFEALIPNRVLRFQEAPGAPDGTRLDTNFRAGLFIKPTVKLDSKQDPNPRFLLVHASAAVGKSAMARFLATETNNPYWDLSKFRVGDGFFSGTGADAFGPSRLGEFLSELNAGKLSLILDSADEAAIASSWANYEAAIKHLVRLVDEAEVGATPVVIFGRYPTIFETAAILEGIDVPCAMFEISYFEESSAREFIRLRAEHQSKEALHSDFERFLDFFFSTVKPALVAAGWEDSASFLGYAPVLDSVATFYSAGGNSYKRLQTVLGSEESRGVWRILYDLIGSILVREQGKFANAVGGGDEQRAGYAASVYSPEFQARLLLHEFPELLEAPPGHDWQGYTEEWRESVQEKIESQFELHPFIVAGAASEAGPLEKFSNIAFRDFVISQFVGCYDERDDDVGVLGATLDSPAIKFSGLLCEFIQIAREQADSTRKQADSKWKLPMPLLSAVLRSHSSNQSMARMAWLVENYDLPEDSPDELLLFFGRRPSGNCFIPVDMAGPIDLGWELSSISVVLPKHELVIGGPVPEANIGPMFQVSAGSVRFSSPGVKVIARGPDDAVSLATSRLGGIARSVSVPDDSLLRLVGVSAPYPWARYCLPTRSSECFPSLELMHIGLQLRSLVNWFSKGSGKMTVRTVDSLLVKGRVSGEVFRACQDGRYIWRDGDSYRFKAPADLNEVRDVNLGGSTEYRQWLEETARYVRGEISDREG